MSKDIPEELDHHHTNKCSYACWSTEPSIISNATAHGCKPRSKWARTSYTVELIANTIISCDCDDNGVCKHITHVIENDWRGCIEYNPDIDDDRVKELKAFARDHRKHLYNELQASQ
jgi:hypothetical protein